MPEPAPLVLTDLPAQLAGPDGAAVKTRHLDELNRMALRVRTAMSAGHDPARFALWQAAERSVQAAIETLEATACLAPARTNPFLSSIR
jgi:hypothetical protein